MKISLSFALTVTLLASCAPNPKTILQKSWNKCTEIRNGTYDEEFQHFTNLRSDTVKNSFHCDFIKETQSNSVPFRFHQIDTNQNKAAVYSDSILITYTPSDSIGEIINYREKNCTSLNDLYMLRLFQLVTNDSAYILPHDKQLENKQARFKLIGIEKINGVKCYRIKYSCPMYSTNHDTFNVTNEFWIQKKSFIPIQYNEYFEQLSGFYFSEFRNYRLLNYRFNVPNDSIANAIDDISNHLFLSPFDFKRPDLLADSSVAPYWKLPKMMNPKDSVSLDQLKGKVVLLEFFYKGCSPCMQAVPALQALSEKYKDQGLVVIGIDPYDNNDEKNLSDFLQKRGAGYQILLEGKPVAKDYHVYGFPTLYLIDRKGIIRKVNVGYGGDTEKKVVKYIEEILAESTGN
ncbi:MAG: redoxin domain-containing protein [Bacteroidetes bacterium]|nr:redoxin domain-containing protein [Bacteroidota bacterium]